MTERSKYTTISITFDTFDELYALKGILMKGTRDKSWEHFMRKLIEITNNYINVM